MTLEQAKQALWAAEDELTAAIRAERERPLRRSDEAAPSIERAQRKVREATADYLRLCK